ncbi:hypothetical protein GOV08_02460 [Candidatus Woesearchaeota archaeon]|nr:hypothetical protein [Candidatus Woesearchaeota archaeon]
MFHFLELSIAKRSSAFFNSAQNQTLINYIRNYCRIKGVLKVAHTGIQIVYLFGIFLLGFGAVWLSNKYKFPSILLLLLIGAILKKSGLFVYLSNEIVFTLATFALVVAAFDSACKVDIRKEEKEYKDALKLRNITLLLIILIISFFTYILFEINFILAMIFATLISIVEFDRFKPKDKVHNILLHESIVSVPLAIAIVLILNHFLDVSISFQKDILSYTLPIITGIGVGVVVGIVLINTKQKHFNFEMKFLVLASAILLAFLLSEVLGGISILSVLILGLIIGNIELSKKEVVQDFFDKAMEFFEIIVIIAGILVINLLFTNTLIFKALLLFIIYLLTRLASVFVVFTHSKLDLKEKLELALNIPKGGVALMIPIALFFKYSFNIELIVSLSILFVVFSTLLYFALNLYIQKKSSKTE